MVLHSVILTQQTYLGAFGRKCRLLVEAAAKWQCSYILELLDSGAGICPSLMLPGHSLTFAPCATCDTGRWRLGGTDMSIPLRVLAVISPSVGWRVRPYTVRTKQSALFSSGRRKCSLLCSSSSTAGGECCLARQDGVSPFESWHQARSSKNRDIDAPG